MWRISKNLIDSSEKVCKKYTSFDYKEESKAALQSKFRLLDDDGEVYFYGWNSTNDDEAAFRPLDELGASYGCTEIQYKNEATGKYEIL